MDEQQCRLPDHRITAGCTAVVALVVDGEVIVANAGDSKVSKRPEENPLKQRRLL